ncbi:MAG: hypothetical protein Q9M40_00395 [Sulfurimonas sp.]|nr:hypothetical protein [Sulfurimonas sp.]
MAEIDKVKEEIGAIKTYLGFIIAFIITLGAGSAKVYLENSSDLLISLGILGILFSGISVLTTCKSHAQKIKSLRDL